MGRIYSVQFRNVSISTKVDLFSLQVPADRTVIIHSVRLGNTGGTADAGDTESELLPILMGRFTGAAGSGGALGQGNSFHASEAASTCIARTNDTTQAAGFFPILVSDAWNVQIPYLYQPTPEERLIIQPDGNFVCTLDGIPADALSCNGTLTYEELG